MMHSLMHEIGFLNVIIVMQHDARYTQSSNITYNSYIVIKLPTNENCDCGKMAHTKKKSVNNSHKCVLRGSFKKLCNNESYNKQLQLTADCTT